MKVLLFMGVFWIIYGMAGLLGFQNIPAKYKGYRWTKDYIRFQGISWLMIGLPYLAFYLVITFCFPDTYIHPGRICLIVLALGIPAIIFTIIGEKKYKALLAAEAGADSKTTE